MPRIFSKPKQLSLHKQIMTERMIILRPSNPHPYSLQKSRAKCPHWWLRNPSGMMMPISLTHTDTFLESTIRHNTHTMDMEALEYSAEKLGMGLHRSATVRRSGAIRPSSDT